MWPTAPACMSKEESTREWPFFLTSQNQSHLNSRQHVEAFIIHTGCLTCGIFAYVDMSLAFLTPSQMPAVAGQLMHCPLLPDSCGCTVWKWAQESLSPCTDPAPLPADLQGTGTCLSPGPRLACFMRNMVNCAVFHLLLKVTNDCQDTE